MSDVRIKSATITLRLTPVEKQAFRKYAENIGTTMQNILEDYIKEILEKNKK